MTVYPSHSQLRISRLSDACRQVLVEWDDDRILAAFIYGSVLGERWRSDSDVDIAILDRAEDRLTWEDEAKLMDAFERTTEWAVDIRLLRDSSLSHQVHVLTEGRPIWTREAESVEKYSESVLQEFRRKRDGLSSHWLSLIDRLACKIEVHE